MGRWVLIFLSSFLAYPMGHICMLRVYFVAPFASSFNIFCLFIYEKKKIIVFREARIPMIPLSPSSDPTFQIGKTNFPIPG